MSIASSAIALKSTSAVWILLLLLTSCGSGRTVLKKPEITESVVENSVIKKKRAVIIRYYTRPGVMYEQPGTLRPSEKPNYVVFQYYNHDEKQFVELELPLQNISEISYENRLAYDTRVRLIGVTTLLVAGLVVMGIYN